MPSRKPVQPDSQLPLKLNLSERKLLLDGLTCLDGRLEQIIRDTPSGQPVMMTIDDLEELAGYVAAEANHSPSKRKVDRLDTIFERITEIVDKSDMQETQTTSVTSVQDSRVKRLVLEESELIIAYAQDALDAAERMNFKNKRLKEFQLGPGQLELLLMMPNFSSSQKNKLAMEAAKFTMGDVIQLTSALAQTLPDCDSQQQVVVLIIARNMIDQIQAGFFRLVELADRPRAKRRPNSAKTAGKLYQFKITLLRTKPAIWRRIQVVDCTLDQLHQHIQTAMGWTNSHLHLFEIKGKRYGDLELLNDAGDDFECIDSTRTKISKILPRSGEPFRFRYEYDFGDSWEHEILFEGNPERESGAKYPLCLEGERACPPEDVGGVWGYSEFCKAIADSKHERRAELLAWYGGSFDADWFDATLATSQMQQGLPDWRMME